MSGKSTDVQELMIVIGRTDGQAVLSGISYTDLRDLITGATLYHQANPPKIEKADDVATHQSNMDIYTNYLHTQHVLEILNIKLGRALNPDLVSGSTTRVRALYSYRVARLEEMVTAAEALAGTESANSVKAATERMAQALREATQALMVVKRHT